MNTPRSYHAQKDGAAELNHKGTKNTKFTKGIPL